MMSLIGTATLKRKLSLSDVIDDYQFPSKIQKQNNILDDFTHGGARIANIRAVAVDANGDEYRYTQINPAPGITQYGLPTPGLTPLGKDNDPFDKVQSSVPCATTAPDGISNLAYVGNLHLFGIIPAKLYVYEHLSSVLHPYNEVVKIAPNGNVSLGTLLPSLKNSEWDVIALKNPEFGFLEDVSLVGGVTRFEGLYFDTDIVFQGALQPVSDFLRDFFGQEDPAIRLSAWLSPERHYSKAFTPTSFVLKGSLEHVCVNVLDILTFREIGLELSGYQSYNVATKENDWSFGYGFFGQLDLSVPGTVAPIEVGYYLQKQATSWLLQIHLQNDEWTDIFGIKNLNLTDVTLQTRMDFANPKSSKLSFGIEANLELRKTQFGIRGHYSKDFYSIAAYIGDLTLQDVGELFHELIGLELDVFSHDVVFRSMTLCISSQGFELSGEVTINGHTSASGGLRFSSDGIAVYGGIGDVDFEHITIKQASLDVFIASKLDTQCAQGSKVDIFGHVSIQGVDIKAALHTEKTQDGDFRWTIYGEVEGDVTTSKIVPDLKDTFLDVSLNHLALIASNHEAPSGSYKGINYPVAKGLQFCAGLDSIPQLEQLMRGSVKGMTFRAVLADGCFGMGIILPTERTITFGDNVYTGPLMIEVAKVGSEVNLILKALLNVKVDTQPDPLAFSLGLKASLSGASAYAQMLTDWVNPCDIGKQITIKGCALEFGIVYSTFFTTGMPGAIGVAGQLMIGKKEAKVAMKLSQNPKEQILAAAVKDLGVVDLVKFASLVCDYKFPEPDDFLHFNDVQLYLSTGASIAETYYPPGASLKGDMTIFGKNAKFECTIGSMVKIMATIEHFDLGSLTVKGATGADPIVDIELSSSKQSILIDGAVEIWALSAALHLEAEVYPQPKFDFWVDISLSDWFKFKLDAKLSGDIDFKDLSTLANAEFSVHGLMEQHILDNIIGMIDQQIKSMHENSDFEEAKKRLTQKEEEFNASVQAAQTTLNEARAAWEKKKGELLSEFDRAKLGAAQYLQLLKDNSVAAEKTYVNTVAAATAILEEARHNEAVAIHLAEVELHRAQVESDDTIRQAQNELHRKRDSYQLAFGNVMAELKQAKQSTDQAQAFVEAVNKDMTDIDNRLSECSVFDMPVLIAGRVAKTIDQVAALASLTACQAVLYAAELLIQGEEYVAATSGITQDETALDMLIQSRAAIVAGAANVLQNTQKSHQDLVEDAQRRLTATQTTSSEQQALAATKSLLEGGSEKSQSMIAPAEKAYNDRFKCTEYGAVTKAEKALKSAQSNSVELELARQACELVEEDYSSFADDILEVGLNIGKWIASAAAELINITKIEFSGSTASFTENGPPLIVKIEGKLLGQPIDIDISWQPNFNLGKFIKAIFSQLWETIKDAAGKFLEAIGAKIVEIAEDIAEAVGEAAEAIGEGVEKAAEAVAEGAQIVGEAIEDVAEDIDDALSDAGSAINDAASEVGHAVENVVDDIDDAFSDAGSAINDAASDVGHAVEDVVDDVGDAFNDAGNAIENVASDFGNTISGWFS